MEHEKRQQSAAGEFKDPQEAYPIQQKESAAGYLNVFPTSYTNKTYQKRRDALLGKAFSLWRSLKMGAVGSGRLRLLHFSDSFPFVKAQLSEQYFANIELRPKGIIVHFSCNRQCFSWCIPYYQLVLYRSDYFSIHANGLSVRFKMDAHYRRNKKFIKRMMDYKQQYWVDHGYQR